MKMLYIKSFGSDEERSYDLDMEFNNYIQIMIFSPEARVETKKEWERGVFERLSNLMRKGVIRSYRIEGGSNGKENC